MFKYYVLYPMLYGMFFATSHGRRFYRYLANTVGQQIKIKRGFRDGLMYQGRHVSSLLVDQCGLKNGSTLLEMGTGHWHGYSTFIKCFFDVNLDLFDVKDNRQFELFKHNVSGLRKRLTAVEKEQCQERIDKILAVTTFDELYSIFGGTYTIDNNGSLHSYPDNHFDIVFSHNVFEHIDKNALTTVVAEIKRMLKPGGYSAHFIDISDHRSHNHLHVKQYLKFSDSLWKSYFESSFQYINRVQRSEWLSLFEDSGLNLIYKKEFDTDITNLKVHKDYQSYSHEDLKCFRLEIVHRKQ